MKTLKRLALALFLSVSFVAQAQNTYSDQLLEIMIQDARGGNLASANMLGNIYLGGHTSTGTPDPRQAAIWWQMAADREYPPANFNLGLLYERGPLGTVDLPRAKHHFELSSKAGFERATEALQRVNAAIASGTSAAPLSNTNAAVASPQKNECDPMVARKRSLQEHMRRVTSLYDQEIEENRQASLQAFLSGAGGRRYGVFSAGATAAAPYDERGHKLRLERDGKLADIKYEIDKVEYEHQRCLGLMPSTMPMEPVKIGVPPVSAR